MWIWAYLRTAGSNFHEVVPGKIYRGATPSPGNLAEWSERYGLRTWIDLRMPSDYKDSSAFAAQCTAARTFKIERISAPCSDRLPLPDATVDVVLELLQDETKYPLIIACNGGRHRAGAMIALYRKRVCGWSGEQAYAEAKKVGGYYPNGHETYDKHFRYLLGIASVVLVVALTLALIVPTALAQGSGPAAPPAATTAAKTPAPLDGAELAQLAGVVDALSTAQRELQTAQLFLEAAQRKAESAQYFSQARRLRILAKRGLDPDLWDITLVNEGTEQQPRQVWRLVPLEKEKPKP